MGFRNLLLLVLGVIGLALVRTLIPEITRLVTRGMAGAASGASKKAKANTASQAQRTGRLQRDPQTGTYVDPVHAVKASVRGETHYFESESSRDKFIRARATKT